MDGFGLDWEAVHAINPRRRDTPACPPTASTGRGGTGSGSPRRWRRCPGLAWVTGYADGPPMLPRGPCDPNGAMHAAFAMQVALAARDATGEGQLVEAPLIESALNIAAEQVVEYTAYGTLLEPHGEPHRRAPPRRACLPVPRARSGGWPCRSCTDEQWAGLRKALGDPAWAADDALSIVRGAAGARRRARRRAGGVGRRAGSRRGGRPAHRPRRARRRRSRTSGPSRPTRCSRPGASSRPSTTRSSAPTRSRCCRSDGAASTAGSGARRRWWASTTAEVLRGHPRPVRRRDRELRPAQVIGDHPLA